jgi:hypothetical protein
MCIHSKKDADRYLATMKSMGYKQGSIIGVTYGRNEFAGLPVYDVADDEQVAEALQDLKTWHGLEHIDLTGINDMRKALGLYALDMDALPVPRPTPEKWVDPTYIREMYAV